MSGMARLLTKGSTRRLAFEDLSVIAALARAQLYGSCTWTDAGRAFPVGSLWRHSRHPRKVSTR